MARNARLGKLVLSAAVLTMAAQFAGATEVRRNNTVILSDNYDLDGSGGNDLVGNKSVADTGTWGLRDSQVVVADAVAPGPKPIQGSGYLQINHDGNNTDGGGRLVYNLPSATVLNDVVKLTSMVYVPTPPAGVNGAGSDDFDYQFSGYTSTTYDAVNGSTGLVFVTGIRDAANSGSVPAGKSARIDSYDGTAYQPSSTFITYDKWQKWEITYTQGTTPTFTWTVDGVGGAMNLFGARASNSLGTVLLFDNFSGINQPLYLDAVPVPEPVGLSLIALGGMALVGRRSRRSL